MFRRLLRLPPEWAWAADVALVAAAVLLALLIHALFFLIMGRAARRSETAGDDAVLARVKRPSRWVLVAVAVATASRFVAMEDEARDALRQVLGLVIPGLLGWLAVSGLRGMLHLVELRADISVEDNLRARRKRTRAAILGRIGVFAIVFVTLCLMLLSIPSIRTIGVTLAASAGIAGLVVGAAAQPALKNLIAGVQMAFTEPIRIDDVVIVEGEWGRIEEIRLTYVVVRIWDERRLVVPVSRFLEQPFQNWTRETSALTGAVSWFLDPATDLDRLRPKVEELIRANKRWDGRAAVVQVVDARADAIEVRALMTARDAGTAFDLRCDVREGVLKWLRYEMPEALPRRRLLLDAQAGTG